MIDRRLLLSISTIFLSISLFAIPARRGVSRFLQPDGSSFEALVIGDEFGHIKKTTDGCAIIQDEDGWWSYAAFDADGSRYSSGVHVGDKAADAGVLNASRNIPLSAISAKSRATRSAVESDRAVSRRLSTRNGNTTQKCLVILAEYNDVKFTSDRQDFVDMLTEEGYSENGGTGSVKDFFDAQFQGKYEFEFTVSEIVTLPKNRKYYGANDADGEDQHPDEMIREACRLADPDIDFSVFDQDADGSVDNIFVFYAGEGEADSHIENTVWPHSSHLRYGELRCDGKDIGQYACASELNVKDESLSGKKTYGLTGIGTFCHEYTHTLGVSDFYDTDYDNYESTVAAGHWGGTCLMDSGNYNNYGQTPPYYNACIRDELGLWEAEPIRPGRYSLEPINTAGRYLRLNTADENEYFLIECRSDKGWDQYINSDYSSKTAKGLLIYHIDKSDSRKLYSYAYDTQTSPRQRWQIYNEVNADPAHQCADLIEADMRPDNLSWDELKISMYDISGVFFPEGGDSFGNFKDWNGNKLPYSLTDIRIEGDNVSFNVVGEGEVEPEPEPEPGEHSYAHIDFGPDFNGTFHKGMRIPLKISGGRNISSVSWTLDGKSISASVNAYYGTEGRYVLEHEGVLKATVNYQGGASETITRKIKFGQL